MALAGWYCSSKYRAHIWMAVEQNEILGIEHCEPPFWLLFHFFTRWRITIYTSSNQRTLCIFWKKIKVFCEWRPPFVSVKKKHSTWRIVVTTTVIVSFPSCPSGMRYTYLLVHCAKLDRYNYAITIIPQVQLWRAIPSQLTKLYWWYGEGWT